MDFYRIGDCLVADRSLQSFFKQRNTKGAIVLVFLDRLPKLPEVGISLLPSEYMFSKCIDPVATVAYRPWNMMALGWESLKVERFSYLKIRVLLENQGIGLQFSFSRSELMSPSRFYIFPHGFRDGYIAIAGDGIFDEQGRCTFALLGEKDFKKFIREKNLRRVIQNTGLRAIGVPGVDSFSPFAGENNRGISGKIHVKRVGPARGIRNLFQHRPCSGSEWEKIFAEAYAKKQSLLNRMTVSSNNTAPGLRTMPKLEEIRRHAEDSLLTLRSDHRRLLNPTPYKVSLSVKLYAFLHKIWLQNAPVGRLE